MGQRFLEYWVYSIDRDGDAADSDVFTAVADARKYFCERCEEISLPINLAQMDEEDPVGFVLEKMTMNRQRTLMWYGDASLMDSWAHPADAFHDPLKQLLVKAKSRTKKGVVPAKENP
jgi:hypothetical protein